MLRSRIGIALILAFAFSPAFARAIDKGDVAPDVVLVSHTDPELNLSSYAGKVVYLDFWASWCGPCKKSLAWMSALQKKYGTGSFQVVAVNLDESKDDADRALRETNADLFVVYDPAGKLPAQFGITAMPSSFLIDRNGKIVSAIQGFSSEHSTEIAAQIDQLINR